MVTEQDNAMPIKLLEDNIKANTCHTCTLLQTYTSLACTAIIATVFILVKLHMNYKQGL